MGEIGNDLGPTLEFYRLIVEKMIENKECWYKNTDKSIYPAIGLNNNKKAINLFKLLGFIVARIVYDGRLLDFPKSRIFWNLLLDRSVKISDIKNIDKDLYNVLNDLFELINKKRNIFNKENNITDEELEEKILYNGKQLNSIDIYFAFQDMKLSLNQMGKNILLYMKGIKGVYFVSFSFLALS